MYSRISLPLASTEIVQEKIQGGELPNRGGEGTIIWTETIQNGFTEEETTRLVAENPDDYPATTSAAQ